MSERRGRAEGKVAIVTGAAACRSRRRAEQLVCRARLDAHLVLDEAVATPPD
jgi:hypothetical protein